MYMSLSEEFRKLEATPGNDSIRCSRMHFGEWAKLVEDLVLDLQRVRIRAHSLDAQLTEVWRERDVLRQKLVEARKVVEANLHVRRCWECQHEFYAKEGYTPYCLCPVCGSQDTRRRASKEIVNENYD